MSKNKIVFAGVMGAILMSAGANAATTSIATRGYVDQEIGRVSTTVETIEKSYVTLADVTDAIESGVDLVPYQVTANMVQALKDVENPTAKYPSVAAVAAALENLDLGLNDEQIAQLQELIQSDGVVSQISTLKGRVDALTGTGDGSVAKSIADAISSHTTAANAAYQAKSDAAYSFGTANGEWDSLSEAQIAALDSGITKAIVESTGSAITGLQEAIDGLNGKDGVDGTITTIEKTISDLQEAIDGLNGNDGADGTITTIEKTISELQEAIDGLNGKDGVDGTIATIEKTIADLEKAINDETTGLVAKVDSLAEEIADKISNPPAECVSESGACVLMINNGNVSWVQVTNPLGDTGASAGE